MSETRWNERSSRNRGWFSPSGEFEVRRSKGFWLRVGYQDIKLAADNWDDACREAERIIAARCRDTLKMLGDE